MMDYKKHLLPGDGSPIKTLSLKDDSAVLLMQRPDNSLYVLRIYKQEMPVYHRLQSDTESDCINLPKIYQCEIRDDYFFVKEEYINGISLACMLEGSNHMDESKTCEIASAVCSAGEYLHEMGYIHRDIKPEHVLLTAEGRTVLVDFDAAMAIRRDKQNDTQLLGTATYAAPEQFGLVRCDERTDIYSIGILINEMLTGVHPSVKLYKNGSLGRIIEKCTSINPDDRYQSLRQLDFSLHTESVSAAACETSAPKTNELPVIEKTPSKRLLVIILAVIIVCAGGFGLYSMMGKDEPPAGKTSSGPAVVENTEYLQLYMEDGATTYPNFRQGAQSAPLFTENGERLDQSFSVYTDEAIGFTEWDEGRGDWRLVSEGKMPGNTGFFYAEKDGKKYAIRVLVYGEPICVYTDLPDVDDLASGYVLADINRQNPAIRTIAFNYTPGEKFTFYLVASPGFTFDSLRCDSDLITITDSHSLNYTYPVKEVTFDNPAGGNVSFQVTSEYNTYIFNMNEK